MIQFRCYIVSLFQVKFWMTFNEPWAIAYKGYGLTYRAPGLGRPGTADYIAGHNIIKAHANVYRLYERKWRPLQHGINLSVI